jgi:hypothetical protein
MLRRLRAEQFLQPLGALLIFERDLEQGEPGVASSTKRSLGQRAKPGQWLLR